jgi:CelD/BcsL family acetyltransferase involved in cellulose biosynthesis
LNDELPGSAHRERGVSLERIPYQAAAWDAVLEQRGDAEAFHSSAWLAFLTASQGAEPVVAIVRQDGRPVGWFVGAIVRRFGLRILGSPLKGWGTQFMGFLLDEGADRLAAAEALVRFAFRDLRCVHVELADPALGPAGMAERGFEVEAAATFMIDLEPPEDVVFARVRRTTRQAIRKELRRGLRSEVASDLAFADEFHAQLRDVFAHHGLAAPFGVERVRQLIRVVQPTGQLLLIRIRAPDGAAVGTAIAIVGGRTAVGWGLAWLRDLKDCHPVELLWWEMIRLSRARGAHRFDCAGLGDYKAKYGGVPVPTYRFHRSRSPVLRLSRAALRGLIRGRQRVLALGERLVARRPHPAGPPHGSP